MNTGDLLFEINSLLPSVAMPCNSDLTFHKGNCLECEYLRKDLEEFRDSFNVEDVIRCLCNEISLLSAKTWRWILPHYLRFCLTPEAEYSRTETEFLVYSLAPEPEFLEDAIVRLSSLSQPQLHVLIHFLQWCLMSTYWEDYFEKDILLAIEFLNSTIAKRSN